MSNTLNTPIEALELEFPLRVERYELRYGSGGSGRFTAAATASSGACACSSRQRSRCSRTGRRHAPAGRDEGSAGACGENLVDGVPVPPKHTAELRPGQTVSVLTPGGGGWGAAEGSAEGHADASRNVGG